MKKSFFLILSIIIVLMCVSIYAQAENLSQDFAESNGFTIYTNPKTNETYYINAEGYIPNRIEIYTVNEIDIEPYNNGEKTELFGIEVTKIEEYTLHSPFLSAIDDITGYCYVLHTVNYYTNEQVKTLLANVDGISQCSLVYGAENAPAVAVTGDVNGNGKIDARDYLLLKRAYFGTYTLACDMETADINGNGKLDPRDYLLLKRSYFGTYTIGTPDATPDEA